MKPRAIIGIFFHCGQSAEAGDHLGLYTLVLVCTIDIHTFCGGIELFVPTHVNVVVKSRSFIGGVGNHATHTSDPKAPSLHIVASNFFGGVDVKN